jgi:hypothetical protein
VILHSVSFVYNDIIPFDFRQHIFVFDHVFISCQKDVESQRKHSILKNAFSDGRSSLKYDFRHFRSPTIEFEFPICDGSEKSEIGMLVLFVSPLSALSPFHRRKKKLSFKDKRTYERGTMII